MKRMGKSMEDIKVITTAAVALDLIMEWNSQTNQKANKEKTKD